MYIFRKLEIELSTGGCMKKLFCFVLMLCFISSSLFAQDDVLKKIYGLYDEKKFDEALALVDKTMADQGENSRLLQAKFYLLKELDKVDEALAVALRREELAERKSPWNCIDIVEMYLAKKDKDNAIQWLTTAVDRGYNGYQSLEGENYAFLQNDARMKGLIQKIKDNIGLDKPAKDFSVALLDGSNFTLSKQKGKVVLIDFWATWCGPCRKEMPNVKKVYAENKDKGFEIIGISLDNSQEPLDKYIQEEELGWKFSYSGKGWKDDHVALYGVNSIPSMWLVDKKGLLRHFGIRGEALEEAVAELVAE